jgi:type IV secretory pathway ATPase VirB11/archaellum biosynthesis ATPase/molecular chaperone GrpE (heat shock protein)
LVDARLPDGSRVNAIIPPLALDGPVLSIRRFATTLDVRGLVANGALNAEMAQLLAACVHARLNILISGGTGAGKSTLLNALSSFIPGDERIITIEDAAELRLQQEHVVRLETRPPNVEGRGEVVARDLVKNALRMRPNRIIVGEVRSVEALDMLQAMNTGHDGSMTTIHANTPRDAISRLETMLLMAGTTLPARAMREQIAAAIDVVVQVSRLSDGTRRISSITEVQGLEGDVVTTADIFQFRRRGVSPQGRVLGHFEATGVRPHFAERLAVAGAQLPADLFREPSRTRLSEMEHEAEESTRAASLERFDAIAHTLPSHARGTAIGEIPAPSPFQRDGEGDGRAVATLTAERRRLQATVDESQRALAAAREEIAALQQQVRARPASAPNDGAAAAELARLRTQAETALADAAALRDQQRRSAVAMLAFVEALDETREIAASPEGDCRQAVNRLGSRATWFIDAVGLHETARVGDPIRADEHDVLERVPRTAGQQEGEIVRVVQRGFRLGDRVLRRAQVVVAS